MKRTPLFAAHQKLGGKLIEFGGWEMPVQYTSIMDEHLAVRQVAGIFDISHMGEVRISGPDAERFLNQALTNDARKLAPGQGQYTLMCNERAGVIDDDKLFLDDFAGEKIVVFAREPVRLATEVSQQRPIVAEQGLSGSRGNPVGALEGKVRPFVALLDKVGAEAGPLQILPVHLELLAAFVHALAQLPENRQP